MSPANEPSSVTSNRFNSLSLRISLMFAENTKIKIALALALALALAPAPKINLKKLVFVIFSDNK